jgi:hypothetical protein
MTTHAPALAFGHDQTLLPNQPFFSWIRSQSTLFVSQIAAVLSLLYFVSALIVYSTEAAGESFFTLRVINVYVDYAHVVFIVIFIFVLIRFLNDNSRGAFRVSLVHKRVFGPEAEDESRLAETENQLREFKRYFLGFWCCMLVLYITFSIQHSFQLLTQDQSTDSVLESTAALKVLFVPFLIFAWNNFSLWCIFLCFVVLYLPAYKGPQRKLEADEYPARRLMLTKKLRRRLLRGSFAFVILLTLSFPGLLLANRQLSIAIEGYAAVFDAISGTLNALVLALLIARLDSKLIGLPSWLVCVLYFYSAVQPLFVVFEQSSAVLSGIKTAVLIAVFIFKIYFFLIILYTLQTGRMLNYLYCFPRLSRQVNKAESEELPEPANTVDDLEEGPENQHTGSYGVPAALLRSLLSWIRKKIILSLVRIPLPLLASYLIGLAASSYFLLSLIGYAALGAKGAFPFNPSNITIDLSNLFLISIAIVILSRVRRDNQRYLGALGRTFHTIFNVKPSRSKDFQSFQQASELQVQRFRQYFLWFWCAMLALYIVFALEHGADAPWLNQNSAYRLLAGLGTTYPFLYPLLEFVLSSLNLLFVFWCFVTLYLPAYNPSSANRQKLLIHHSLFIVVVFIAAFPLFSFLVPKYGLENYDAVFEGAVGTLSAVALALLIARLDSKLIGLSTWLICILLAYSAIQPLSVVFHQHPAALQTIKTSVLLAALGFKICFFLIILHSLQSGRIQRYLVCFPFLNKRVDSIFENQFEIKTYREKEHAFTFSIWRKNSLVYSTDTVSTNRKECDKRIRKLQRLMKTDKAYAYGKESGTHWVEVRDSRLDLICESSPLRSKDEARDLIEESMDKIPYCKYNRA